MFKVKALLVAITLAVFTVTIVSIQTPHKAGTLTPDDYAQIQHLYVRYAHGIDNKPDNGMLYASVFIPDSRFITHFEQKAEGLETLTQTWGVTKTGKPNPISIGHQTWNVMIEPAPWGALGIAYYAPGGGYYWDTIVKTPQGWRFKYRNYRADFPAPPL